jgi:hypothetical protein
LATIATDSSKAFIAALAKAKDYEHFPKREKRPANVIGNAVL